MYILVEEVRLESDLQEPLACDRNGTAVLGSSDLMDTFKAFGQISHMPLVYCKELVPGGSGARSPRHVTTRRHVVRSIHRPGQSQRV